MISFTSCVFEEFWIFLLLALLILYIYLLRTGRSTNDLLNGPPISNIRAVLATTPPPSTEQPKTSKPSTGPSTSCGCPENPCVPCIVQPSEVPQEVPKEPSICSYCNRTTCSEESISKSIQQITPPAPAPPPPPVTEPSICSYCNRTTCSEDSIAGGEQTSPSKNVPLSDSMQTPGKEPTEKTSSVAEDVVNYEGEGEKKVPNSIVPPSTEEMAKDISMTAPPTQPSFPPEASSKLEQQEADKVSASQQEQEPPSDSQKIQEVKSETPATQALSCICAAAPCAKEVPKTSCQVHCTPKPKDPQCTCCPFHAKQPTAEAAEPSISQKPEGEAACTCVVFPCPKHGPPKPAEPAAIPAEPSEQVQAEKETTAEAGEVSTEAGQAPKEPDEVATEAPVEAGEAPAVAGEAPTEEAAPAAEAESTPAEVPVQEGAPADAPAEEPHAEEVPTDEAPAEEAKEAPTEEAPPAEVPTEEAPAEEAKEVPTEEAPPEETSTEQPPADE